MEVQIKQTTFVGEENVCKLTGQSFYSYLGIPYAKAPIGDLRFQPPQKLDNDDLEEECDATVEGDDCIQMSRIREGTTGSEDCLYLNVYAPKDDAKDLLKPVVVFVHGGIFTYMSGSPTNFSPDYLMSHDVIVVTINFRLHLFGFLDLSLPECPGNVGLLDQKMAFEWVKENIQYFGGDPENVTAFGNSSGAFAVHILSMSPLTKDLKLFNKMILVGGNALTIPLGQRNPVDTAFELGHRLGYRGKNREHLLKFFKSLPAEELTEAMNAYYLELKMEHKGNVFHFPFLPTVQRHTQDAIIPEEPEEMLKKATKLPTLTGMMNRDGLIAYYLDPFVLNHLVEDFYSVVRKIIPMNERIYRTIVNRIKSEYFKNKDVTYNAFPESVDFFTDVYWTRRLYDILPETELSDSPTYVFQFCHDGALNCYKKYYPVLTRWLEGATHDDMLGYCLPFKIDLGSKFSNKKDVKVVNFVCTLLSNFIKTGNPNGKSIRVQWKPSTQKEAYYLQIADIPKLVAGKINESRITFWKQMEKMIEEAESDSDNSDEESESADD